MVLQLMEKETLAREQVLEIFAPVVKRPSRGSWRGNGGTRRPSDRPPVLTPAEVALLGTNGDGSARRRAASRSRNGNGSAASSGTRRTPVKSRARQAPARETD
jgi:cell division protease FtsH